MHVNRASEGYPHFSSALFIGFPKIAKLLKPICFFFSILLHIVPSQSAYFYDLLGNPLIELVFLSIPFFLIQQMIFLSPSPDPANDWQLRTDLIECACIDDFVASYQLV